MTESSPIISLEYAKAPSRWPKRVLRILLALLPVAGALAARQYGPYAWHQARLLYWQRKCLNFSMPTDAVVYEEEPTAAAQLLRNPEYSPYILRREQDDKAPTAFIQAAALTPHCWSTVCTIARIPFWARGYVAGGPSIGGPASIIFLHERVSPSGHRRLVCLGYLPVCNTFQPAFIPGFDYVVCVVRPVTWTGQPVLAPPHGYAIEVKSSFPRHPPLVRVYAGQPDPTDSSHFTVRYRIWGQEDLLDGRLQDDDTITLTPRHPPDWPRN
jgi:hypothetical protein